ncbi:MAG: bacillithiol biosynthesis cysteine-adding enzyme BshC [Bacteroidetes bacterium]|nr:MAG: bacillithiol biosynthesis cysteine-adding enzyme BshC [Bacteroidota bacterium]TAG86101.1 MAG: bacillithiol biosynthesis cysteine-adding enzyme BshC [Bacteroidota bacterium]
MQTQTIDFEKSHQFSTIFLDYIQQNEKLKPFYQHFPTIENFEKQIELKKNFLPHQRNILVESLQNQYKNIHIDIPKSVDLLTQKNTFTITTGHQLCLATGPLYFIYKIITAINTAKQLKKKYPDYHFVPIYWLASEDHDFAEVNHFYLFGKKIEWKNEQKGGVGRFLLENLAETLTEIADFPADWIQNFYKKELNLSQATRLLVAELFKNTDLVCIDADDKLLKKSFTSIIEKEIFTQKSFEIVEKTTEKLAQNYKTQINPREINLFYIDTQLRERIVKNGNNFEVLNTNITFSEEKLREEINLFPEKFSPNVVLRGIYQEFILPNLAYIGGPGELAYWFQLKDAFENYEVTFPILMPRNFALYISAGQAKKINKFDFSWENWFENENNLKKMYLLKNEETNVSLNEENIKIKEIFDQIKQKTERLDKGLMDWIGAEETKITKALENIEKKLQKTAETKAETILKQIFAVKEKLFPNGSLQERHDNFLNFYINNKLFIQQLENHLNPFDFRLHILIEE